MWPRFRSISLALALSVPIVLGIVSVVFLQSANRHPAAAAPRTISQATNAPPTVDLTPDQLSAIKLQPVGSFEFPIRQEAVGNISYADDLSVDVYPPYQGKLIRAFVELGEPVHKGQALYTIDSPDLIQAESNLIGAAATLELTNRELVRARQLTGANGVSQRELEQAISDQQTAEGALKAARDAVRVFGKSDAQIDRIVITRHIDPALMVPSPIDGVVTAYNAPPGLLVQPGNAPAPFSVANVAIKWMLASVAESDLSFFHRRELVDAQVQAYPGRAFRARITKIYENVDPNTHRVTVRSEIADPRNELRPGMLATFIIAKRAPVEAVAIPANGVVREPDGTMTAWVTTDRRRFTQRVVQTGLRNDGEVQIVAGLERGELAVTDGAVFLSNMLQTPPTD